jgi:hypothetical protein
MAKSKIDKARIAKAKLVLHTRLSHWLNYLGLQHVWHVDLAWKTLSTEGMETTWNTGYRDATITVSYTFIENNVSRPDVIDLFIIHEVLHLLFANVRDSVELNLVLGSPVHKMYVHAEEGLIDNLSRIIRRLNGDDGSCFRSVTSTPPPGTSTSRKTRPALSASCSRKPASKTSRSRAKPSSPARSPKR